MTGWGGGWSGDGGGLIGNVGFNIKLPLKVQLLDILCVTFCMSLVSFCGVPCLLLQEIFLGVLLYFNNARFFQRCNIMAHIQK